MSLEYPQDRPDHWIAAAAHCKIALDALPTIEEPQPPPLCLGDEWKEGMVREAIEGESATQVLEALEHWQREGRWPKLAPQAAFFVAERLEWAGSFAVLLAKPAHDGPVPLVAPSFPPGTRARDVVYFLAWYVYNRYSQRSLLRWCDRSKFDL